MKFIFLKERCTKAIIIKQNITYKTKFNPININGLNLCVKWLGISNKILKT